MSIKSRRRFLVVGRVGDKSLHDNWIAEGSSERSWDLQLNAYGHDLSRIQNGDLPLVVDRGTKWDSIFRYFSSNPELLDLYEYVMLPDDDVIMSADDINRVFEIVVEHDLTIAQPSLSLDSYISYPILLQSKQFRLRYTNFIESMACCIKSSYLRQILPIFERHFTGWGTDLIWALLMKDPTFCAAVIDEVSMKHTRPLYTGPLYSAFSEHKIDPSIEVSNILSCFDNAPKAMLIYGGILRDGRAVSDAEARIRNGLGLLAAASRSKLPYATARMGAATILRIISYYGYRPERLRPVSGSEAERWCTCE
ncbi:DUF707 domain-containing protein [Microvirga tunisiensis]|uniref:DUF707 domain-containing protein n=1 Tax=Microvirga tunisiensis TaxID=2108360 RepID=A0A5N7MU20_9HYPH|nr:DUF707 domain-containing protein [Microvirga tunisiensis]MPR12562.1 DUF707 domain-containing protein [Microvirga tunisiensis]MPR30467.1 DUF707 domain-containing protein [Microvirga tunisiensis]